MYSNVSVERADSKNVYTKFDTTPPLLIYGGINLYVKTDSMYTITSTYKENEQKGKANKRMLEKHKNELTIDAYRYAFGQFRVF